MALSVILLVLLSTWHFQTIPWWQDWFWNKINKYCAIVLFIFQVWKNCLQCVYLRANRFPTTWKNGIQTSSFDFRFLTTYTSEMGIQIFFVFRFPTTLKTKMELLFSFSITSYNRIAIAISVFHRLFSYGIENGISKNFDFLFRFSCFIMLSLFRFVCTFSSPLDLPQVDCENAKASLT